MDVLDMHNSLQSLDGPREASILARLRKKQSKRLV
jgi:hypothetical protein